MYSVVFDLEKMKKHDTMFWLPARGRDNGVPAENWVILAELEAEDVAPVLDMADRRRRRRVRRPAVRRRARAIGCHLLVRGHDAVSPGRGRAHGLHARQRTWVRGRGSGPKSCRPAVDLAVPVDSAEGRPAKVTQ